MDFVKSLYFAIVSYNSLFKSCGIQVVNNGSKFLIEILRGNLPIARDLRECTVFTDSLLKGM